MLIIESIVIRENDNNSKTTPKILLIHQKFTGKRPDYNLGIKGINGRSKIEICLYHRGTPLK